MFTKPYSEETSRIIDEEVGKIIEGSYERAKEILQTNYDKLSALADSLLQNEVIFREDVERILGARPFQKAEPQFALRDESEVKSTDEPTEEHQVTPPASGDAPSADSGEREDKPISE